jgi:hypothetical protein
VLLEQLAKTNAAYITKAAKIHLGKRFILVIFVERLSCVTTAKEFAQQGTPWLSPNYLMRCSKGRDIFKNCDFTLNDVILLSLR